jgi:hypothetical protein
MLRMSWKFRRRKRALVVTSAALGAAAAVTGAVAIGTATTGKPLSLSQPPASASAPQHPEGGHPTKSETVFGYGSSLAFPTPTHLPIYLKPFVKTLPGGTITKGIEIPASEIKNPAALQTAGLSNFGVETVPGKHGPKAYWIKWSENAVNDDNSPATLWISFETNNGHLANVRLTVADILSNGAPSISRVQPTFTKEPKGRKYGSGRLVEASEGQVVSVRPFFQPAPPNDNQSTGTAGIEVQGVNRRLPLTGISIREAPYQPQIAANYAVDRTGTYTTTWTSDSRLMAPDSLYLQIIGLRDSKGLPDVFAFTVNNPMSGPNMTISDGGFLRLLNGPPSAPCHGPSCVTDPDYWGHPPTNAITPSMVPSASSSNLPLSR